MSYNSKTLLIWFSTEEIEMLNTNITLGQDIHCIFLHELNTSIQDIMFFPQNCSSPDTCTSRFNVTIHIYVFQYIFRCKNAL